MGVVYRARDPRLPRDVALKTFLGTWRQDAEARARFAREAEVLARLSHPNLVTVHAVDLEGEQPYLVMDLLGGGSLQDRVESGGPLPPERAVELLRQVAAGLAAAHEQGVLHRDLKPANVLFSESGQAVVTDFGLARAADAESLTQTGQLLGTPAYMPPEQASGDKSQLGPASDVYALGALGYYMLSGKAPFSGASVYNVLHQVLNEPPRSITRQRPEVPSGLERVLLRCLEKDPAARYPSVEAFVGELERCLASPAASQRGGPPLLIAALTAAGLIGLLAATLEPADDPVARPVASLPTPEASSPPSSAGPSPSVLAGRSPPGRRGGHAHGTSATHRLPGGLPGAEGARRSA
jgi:serine/threonine protein kinase